MSAGGAPSRSDPQSLHHGEQSCWLMGICAQETGALQGGLLQDTPTQRADVCSAGETCPMTGHPGGPRPWTWGLGAPSPVLQVDGCPLSCQGRSLQL